MILAPHALSMLRQRWLARRDELRGLHALVDGAVLCESLLAELDALARDAATEPLSLQQAAAESGYSPDHLGRLVRERKITNVGRRNAPRIRRGDLPAKPARVVAKGATIAYDPVADARSLASRLQSGDEHDTT